MLMKLEIHYTHHLQRSSWYQGEKWVHKPGDRRYIHHHGNSFVFTSPTSIPSLNKGPCKLGPPRSSWKMI